MLYDLTIEVIEQYNQGRGEIERQSIMMEERARMAEGERARFAEECERYRTKYIKLQEELTQVKSQYKAWQIHLGSQ